MKSWLVVSFVAAATAFSPPTFSQSSTVMSAKAAKSAEEDLELTRKVISGLASADAPEPTPKEEPAKEEAEEE